MGWWRDLTAHWPPWSAATWMTQVMTGITTFQCSLRPIGPPYTLPRGSHQEYVADLQTRLARCYQIARENLRQAAERQKKVHDTRIIQHPYKPGQAVMKRSPKQTKLHTPWVGPYIVRKNLSDCLLLISDKRRTYAVHHDLLKPCTDECCPKWARTLQAQIRTSA